MNEKDDRDLFYEALAIFENVKFTYWFSQGTLLGLIREGRILPWDSDIDISVWSDEVTKCEVIQLMASHGYHNCYVPGEVDCLHFNKGTKKNIDVGFYVRENGSASIKWVLPGEGYIPKLKHFLISITDKRFVKSDISGSFIKLKLSLFFIWKVLRPIPFVSHFLYTWRKRAYANAFQYRGYSYPVSLFENIIFAEFLGRSIPIPEKAQEVLVCTYGEDWQVPKPNYIWHKEAKNLA